MSNNRKMTKEEREEFFDNLDDYVNDVEYRLQELVDRAIESQKLAIELQNLVRKEFAYQYELY